MLCLSWEENRRILYLFVLGRILIFTIRYVSLLCFQEAREQAREEQEKNKQTGACLKLAYALDK